MPSDDWISLGRVSMDGEARRISRRYRAAQDAERRRAQAFFYARVPGAADITPSQNFGGWTWTVAYAGPTADSRLRREFAREFPKGSYTTARGADHFYVPGPPLSVAFGMSKASACLLLFLSLCLFAVGSGFFLASRN